MCSQITHLKKLRSEIDNSETEFSITLDVIDCLIKYNKIVAEGPTLIRQKEVTEKAEKITEKLWH